LRTPAISNCLIIHVLRPELLVTFGNNNRCKTFYNCKLGDCIELIRIDCFTERLQNVTIERQRKYLRYWNTGRPRICGLFICKFVYLRLQIDHFSVTYPPIYSHSWSFLYANSLYASLIFWSLSIAYNEVQLYNTISWIIIISWRSLQSIPWFRRDCRSSVCELRLSDVGTPVQIPPCSNPQLHLSYEPWQCLHKWSEIY
jgi:hypothetical protein